LAAQVAWRVRGAAIASSPGPERRRDDGPRRRWRGPSVRQSERALTPRGAPSGCLARRPASRRPTARDFRRGTARGTS
jgi:hypothetical protein